MTVDTTSNPEKLVSYTNLADLDLVILVLMNALEARLPLIRYHSESVAYLAVSLGKRLGWSQEQLRLLEAAALLHDIGKIAIPDVILRKTDNLLPAEWEIMKLHPEFSVQIIQPVTAIQPIMPWIYHHHEYWDGSGYPDALTGENIPEATRILTLCDSYDAMTSERLYKNALPPTEALKELERCAGRQFDPFTTSHFVEMIKTSMANGAHSSSQIRSISVPRIGG